MSIIKENILTNPEYVKALALTSDLFTSGKHVIQGNSNRHQAIAFGPLEYSYFVSTHPQEDAPEWLINLAKYILPSSAKVNHFLINKFQHKVGIGTHTDDESIYHDLEGNVAPVYNLSLGNTSTDHFIEDTGNIKVPDNSLFILSSGKLKHKVGIAYGIRYSVTFRYIPPNQL